MGLGVHMSMSMSIRASTSTSLSTSYPSEADLDCLMLLMAAFVMMTPMIMPDGAKRVSLQWWREPANGTCQSDNMQVQHTHNQSICYVS